MFTSSGRLKYFQNPYKLIVEIDQGISDYYRTLVPKYIKLNRQMYPAHISVVRKEIPPNLAVWRKYQNQLVDFEYEAYQYNSDTYYWLNVYSSRLEEIRVELGLTKISAITRSPDGRHRFHSTIGNLKNV